MSTQARINLKKEEVFRAFGCVIWSGNSPAIQIFHWLVVAIFALFNGVLMWVYRKRG